MIYKIFLFPILFTPTILADIESKKHESVTNPTTVTPAYSNGTPTQPAIIPTGENPIATAIYLSITPEDQDPLGISRISDFYGPGSWAGWFITVISAWIRVFKSSEEKFDLNTWLFLLGTNRAAFDLLFGVLAIRRLPRESSSYDADSKSLMGSIGAAFLVTYWGAFHALLQYFATHFTFKSPQVRSRRVWVLELGLILPWMALTSCFSIGKTYIPALYWPGIDSVYHELFLGIAAGTAIEIMPFVAIIAYAEEGSALSTLMLGFTTRANGCIRRSRVLSRCVSAIGAASIVVLLFSMVIVSTTDNDYWLFGWIPTMMFIWPIMGPCLWFLGLVTSIATYIENGYLSRRVDLTESCFFMPCAPQSIKEEDQLFALLGALLLFLGFELYPIVTRPVKEWLGLLESGSAVVDL